MALPRIGGDTLVGVVAWGLPGEPPKPWSNGRGGSLKDSSKV